MTRYFHALWVGGATGACLGVPHLLPELAVVAPAALALLLREVWRASNLGSARLAWVLASVTCHVVALGWLPEAAEVVVGASEPWIWGLAGWLVGGVLAALPGTVIVGTRVDGLLAFAWLAGEEVCELLTNYPGGHLLYGQWNSGIVLYSLASVGWWPTELGMAAIATLLGRIHADTVGRWSIIILALGFGPADTAGEPPTWLAPVLSWPKSPESWPKTAQLLVWPEMSHKVGVVANEGNVGDKYVLPGMGRGVFQLVGARLLTPKGPMNGVILLGPEGELLQTRGKRALAPIGERPLLGMGASEFVAGVAARDFVVGERVVRVLVCFEAYDRAAYTGGPVDVIVVMASDRPFGKDQTARLQQLGVLALRAAEFNAPILRVSKEGPSAWITPRGLVIEAEEDVGWAAR